MNNKGYTTIELVIALALLALLMTFALGPIRGLMLRNQVRNEVELLQLDISFARTEAISRSYPVRVIPNGDWKSGWKIFVDKNNNESQDDDEEDLRLSNFGTAELLLTDSGNNAPIVFTPLGSLSTSTERSLSITHSELNESKAIFISAAGTVSIRSIANE